MPCTMLEAPAATWLPMSVTWSAAPRISAWAAALARAATGGIRPAAVVAPAAPGASRFTACSRPAASSPAYGAS